MHCSVSCRFPPLVVDLKPLCCFYHGNRVSPYTGASLVKILWLTFLKTCVWFCFKWSFWKIQIQCLGKHPGYFSVFFGRPAIQSMQIKIYTDNGKCPGLDPILCSSFLVKRKLFFFLRCPDVTIVVSPYHWISFTWSLAFQPYWTPLKGRKSILCFLWLYYTKGTASDKQQWSFFAFWQME